MSIYQFKIWGKRFAIDEESGNFFEVDDLISKVITLMPRYSSEEILNKLNANYQRERIVKVLRDLHSLKKKGILFSRPKNKKTLVARRITDLTLNIVNNCNLRCSYCWNRAGAYSITSGSQQRMKSDVAFRAIDLLLKESKGANDLVVDFYGGEPLLNFNLIKDVISYCREIQRKKKVKFRFLLATNGTLLSKEKGEFLIENGVDVAVSLDGPRKIQDLQRSFPDGKGSFDAVMSNLKSLCPDYRRRLVGRATFTPHSTKIVSTFKFLRRLGFERIEVCESEKAGYGLDIKNEFFFNGTEGLNRLKSLYYKLAFFYTDEVIKGRLTYQNTYFNRFFKQLSRLYHIHSVIGTCSAGFSLMAVDMDGSIYPCTAFVGLPQFKIGKVISGIDEEKLKNFSNTKISSSKSCEMCWARKICRGCGSCYNLNYFTNKNPGKPDPYYCELFRYKTQLMISMIAQISQKKPSLLDRVLIPEYYAARGKRK